jgi:hypothetical protein
VSVTGTEAEYIAIINLVANTSNLILDREVVVHIEPPSDVQISAQSIKEDKIIFVKSEDLSITNEAEYIAIIQSTANTSNLTSDRQIVVHIESSAPDVQISKYKEDKIILVKSEDLSITTVPQPYEREIYPENIAPFLLTYGDALISEFSSTPISSLSSFTFDTEYTDIQRTFSAYLINTPITGTVSFTGNNVIGIGTNFANNYTVGSSLIVSDAKFIVTSIANSTFLQVNVAPSTSYINVSAYKEQV